MTDNYSGCKMSDIFRHLVRGGDYVTDKRLLTKTDVASILRVSEKTVDRLERDGKIKRHPLSKQVRYTQEEIDRFIAGKQPAE